MTTAEQFIEGTKTWERCVLGEGIYRLDLVEQGFAGPYSRDKEVLFCGAEDHEGCPYALPLELLVRINTDVNWGFPVCRFTNLEDEKLALAIDTVEKRKWAFEHLASQGHPFDFLGTGKPAHSSEERHEYLQERGTACDLAQMIDTHYVAIGDKTYIFMTPAGGPEFTEDTVRLVFAQDVEYHQLLDHEIIVDKQVIPKSMTKRTATPFVAYDELPAIAGIFLHHGPASREPEDDVYLPAGGSGPVAECVVFQLSYEALGATLIGEFGDENIKVRNFYDGS